MTRLRHSGFEARRALPRGVALVVLAALACSKGELTGVGSHLRTPPDTLRAAVVTEVVEDSVFYVPISLARSPTGQIGRQGPYTSQVLFDFLVPTFVVDQGDTLLLASADLVVTFGNSPPFTGKMLVELREVTPEGRGWATAPDTTVILELPPLLPGSPAPVDTVIGGPSGDSRLSFELDLHSLADYDSALARLDTLDVNVALTFAAFIEEGPGFIQFAYDQSTGPAGLFNGGYQEEPGSIVEPLEHDTRPNKHRTVVGFDSTYSPGTNLVLSDGYRLHSYLKFGDLSALADSVLPDSAFIVQAELVLVQATRPDTIFGIGPKIGVVVPSDTTQIFSPAENNRAVGFSADLAALPGTEVVIPVTAYIFDQQEGNVTNRGMLLKLSSEGTSARHFEFHGGRDPDLAKRPQLRLIFGTSPGFGEDPP